MTAKQTDTPRPLTCAELLALPAAVDLETANCALSLSRTTGYALAKRGQYPCTALRLGNAHRLITADLLELLHIDVPESPGIEEPATMTRKADESPACPGHCCCVCRCARPGKHDE